MNSHLRLLPIPGPLLGHYPEKLRPEPSRWSSVSRWCDVQVAKLQYLVGSKFTQAKYRTQVQTVLKLQSVMPASTDPSFSKTLEHLQRSMSKQGLVGTAALQTLALIANLLHKELGLKPFNQQIEAALAMLDGKFVEMATGEGKTISVFLAASCAALAGIPVHLLSANAYLAQRDQLQFKTICDLLKLSTAVLTQEVPREQRCTVYASSIVYATASEVVFDYLNDKLAERSGTPRVMRGLCFALIDEADSVLLDEARTPFVIANLRPDPELNLNLNTALKVALNLVKQDDFTQPTSRARVRLTDHGRDRIDQLGEQFSGLCKFSRRFRRDIVQQALSALYTFEKNVDYIVVNTEVAIIDKNTGRIAKGRRWSDGLHQLVEIKEGLAPSADQSTSAQLTFQRFFPRYLNLTGTSATLSEARSELRAIYGIGIHEIAPRLASQRKQLPTKVFASQRLQFEAILTDVKTCIATGRAVLVGTDSVDQSNQLEVFLSGRGVKVQLLNARCDEHEAALIARAGEPSMVTVATNMAGRGTDIKLAQQVRAAGGLHVISIQANSSQRIDRQLIGRAGRQGDPGTVATYLSLDSGLLKQYGSSFPLRAVLNLGYRNLGPLLSRGLRWYEALGHRRQRAELIKQDEIYERQMSFGGCSE